MIVVSYVGIYSMMKVLYVETAEVSVVKQFVLCTHPDDCTL